MIEQNAQEQVDTADNFSTEEEKNFEALLRLYFLYYYQRAEVRGQTEK